MLEDLIKARGYRRVDSVIQIVFQDSAKQRSKDQYPRLLKRDRTSAFGHQPFSSVSTSNDSPGARNKKIPPIYLLANQYMRLHALSSGPVMRESEDDVADSLGASLEAQQPLLGEWRAALFRAPIGPNWPCRRFCVLEVQSFYLPVPAT